MRLFGHPVHVMLVHFPIALWPAHAALHFFAPCLPAGVSAIAGFWLLIAGTLVGWLAAACGLADTWELARANEQRQLRRGLIHGAINGGVLLAFTALAAVEYGRYPEIEHGLGVLFAELALLLLMGAGNFVGGTIVWAPRADP